MAVPYITKIAEIVGASIKYEALNVAVAVEESGRVVEQVVDKIQRFC
jgi:hypothetical protein